jgi:hypothetical protein
VDKFAGRGADALDRLVVGFVDLTCEPARAVGVGLVRATLDTLVGLGREAKLEVGKERALAVRGEQRVDLGLIDERSSASAAVSGHRRIS